MSRELPPEVKQKIDNYLDNLHFDFQTTPGQASTTLQEEFIIKLLTRFIVSLCSAWWSIREVLDYIQKRKTYKEFDHGQPIS